MKKILIKNFKNLNNYGSGMMGLVTIEEIYNRLNGEVQVYSDFDEYADLEIIKQELNNSSIDINIFKANYINTQIKFLRPFYMLYNMVSTKNIEQFDLIIVLGGDDLSEYYGKHVWPLLLSFYAWSFKTKVVLLGQSIGPFNYWLNKLIFKKLGNRCKIYSRDKFCYDYLVEELGVKKNTRLSGDLAFLDLPLQKSIQYQDQILNKFNLKPNQYICIVISGLFGKYYTNNKENYFSCFKDLIIKIKSNPKLKEIKICLLAHTFPPHGDEGTLLAEFEEYCRELDGIIYIKDKIYQGAARFILGNGKLTITGRMHASVSTFQMGKPSISLSYSVKYKGVIGENLNQSNLIIEANKPKLWEDKSIVEIILSKIDYILNNYNDLSIDIIDNISKQKVLVNEAFDEIIIDLK